MNWIKDRELATRFRNDAVPPKERLIYFMIFMMLSTLISTNYSMHILQATPNQWDYLGDALILCITFVGILWLYRTNAKGDKQEFIERFICLSFPIAIQLLLLLIPALFALFVTESFLHIETPEEQTTPQLMLTLNLLFLYYYTRLNGAFKIASGQ